MGVLVAVGTVSQVVSEYFAGELDLQEEPRKMRMEVKTVHDFFIKIE